MIGQADWKPGDPVRFPRWVKLGYLVDLREVCTGLYVGGHMSRGLGRWDTVIDLYVKDGREDGFIVPPRRLVQMPMTDGDAISDRYMDAAADLVIEARGDVLIHCQAGLSRSASMAFGLMRRFFGMSREEALRRIFVVDGYPRSVTLASAGGWAIRKRR